MSWADLDPAVNQYMPLSNFPKIQLFNEYMPWEPLSTQLSWIYQQHNNWAIAPHFHNSKIYVYLLCTVVEDINGKFDVVIFYVPNVLAEGSAIFVFGFPESVVVVILPQFERAFCYADVGLNLLVVLSFEHGLVPDSLLFAFSV